ncbi:MAG: AarF/ABC1/UbiB kinase family protein [Myxococcales bacterium]|nr:AarF/ABC1/UbiB kinase family protein [Myxococcales bacterium]
MSHRNLPSGRLGRMARLAALGARTGASMVLSGRGEGAAQQAAEVLGSLRGLAAKVGQMASYVDGMVPEAHRDAYENALSKLRAAAPRSSPEAIRALVESELDAPIDRLFAEWDDEPFASASIGQVHRARLEDGRLVAVKVQHPGIERAVESDLQNVSVLERMMALAGPSTLETKRVFDEVAERFREELDYRLEAEHQRHFARVHAEDERIRIPEVMPARSSRRVLTSELVEGLSLEQAALRSEGERRAWAETLWRFVFKGNLVGGRFNADPHPGNYLFRDGGSIWFLDFGCVQPIEPARRAAALKLHLVALAGDSGAFPAAASAVIGSRAGPYEDAAVAYTRRCFAPLFEAPYHITRGYVASLVDDARDMKRHLFSKDSGFVQMPPGMVLINRLQFGFYSVLARLDVSVDYARIERDFLGEAGLLAR